MESLRIFKLGNEEGEGLSILKRRAGIDIAAVRGKVIEILDRVRTDGDEALVELTRSLDDPDYHSGRLQVTPEEIEEAYRSTPVSTVELIREQIRLSTRFHTTQREQIRGWEMEIAPGIRAGEKWTPLDAVGLYVPGGKNPFPTVQQILAVAARAAGCPRIVSCISPRGPNHEVLIAAHECGVSEIYRVSGAQAVAALAYGTPTIRKVDLIAGPGSPYVTCAKILAQDAVAIDMPAGPSEAIILADASLSGGISLRQKARFCAADLLARAEHGPDSAAVLVTDSAELVELTLSEVQSQSPQLSRQAYVRAALARYSGIVLARSLDEAIDFTNEYAPEHLEVLTDSPRKVLERIRNAGSIFLGLYNPVAVGDYASGVNHILPTGGWARRSSAVGVWTFMKRVQFSELTREGLDRLRPIVGALTRVEGLDAHGQSVEIRFQNENG